MNIIKKLLHFVPFVHFYTPWSDTSECEIYGEDERQKKHCTICNKKKYRIVSPI